MATTESSVLLRTVDSSGNANFLYPVTKAENVVGLQETVNQNRLYRTVNVPASGWVGNGPYTQEIQVAGILETDCPHFGVVIVSDAYAETEAFGCVDVLKATAGGIILTCLYDCPDIDLKIQLEVIR